MQIQNNIPNFKVYLPANGRRCLWCLKTIDGSNKYHIIPAYLTVHDKQEYVIPKGIICSSCNSMFSEAENNFVKFFQERLVFFKVPKRDGAERKPIKSSLFNYVTVSSGKISFDLNFAGFNPKSANIAFGLQKRGFDSAYYHKKIDKDNNPNKGAFIHCVVAKIALESLYCFSASSCGDEKFYKETIVNETSNWNKHRKSVYEYIHGNSKQMINNVFIVGSYKGQFSDWNLNINYLSMSFIGKYPIIWVRILGLLFLVNYLPEGNKSLTKNKIWKLVKEHNNKYINNLMNKGRSQGVNSYHIKRLMGYFIK